MITSTAHVPANAQSPDTTASGLTKLVTAGAVTTLCAATFLADRQVSSHFNRPRYREHFWAKSGTHIRSFYQLGLPVITFAAAKVFDDQKLSQTSVQAFTAGTVVFGKTFFIKMLAGRKRPDEGNTTFDFTGPGMLEHTSFISGRTSVAFALATVFSKRYSDQIIIPLISFTAASAIAFSGIMSNEHYLSDVALGAAIGYAGGYWVNKVFESDRFNLYPAFTLQRNAGAGLSYRF